MLINNLFKQIKPVLNLTVKQYSKSSTINLINSLKHYDQTQLTLLNEPCILVDENDTIVGEASKKDCHLIDKMRGDVHGMLHRAFSVFIFDTNKRLLLQQRSLHKITFPNHWTNACCSHPLSNDSEKDESNNNIGIKRAARRRTAYELGIPENQIDLKRLHYITRIQYRAENIPQDGIFAENEIDYVLLLMGDFSLNPNTNEVKSVRYFTEYELREFIDEEKNKDSGVLFTPWFKLISKDFLFKWWQNLDNIEALKDHKIIHKY